MSKLKYAILPAALLTAFSGNVQAEEPGNDLLIGTVADTENGLDSIIDARLEDGSQFTTEFINDDDLRLGLRSPFIENILRVNGAADINTDEDTTSYSAFLEFHNRNAVSRQGVSRDAEGTTGIFFGIENRDYLTDFLNLTLSLDLWTNTDEEVTVQGFIATLLDNQLYLGLGGQPEQVNFIAGNLNPGDWGLYTRTGFGTEEHENVTFRAVLADESNYGIGNFQFYNEYFNNVGWGGEAGHNALPGWVPFDANTSDNIAVVGDLYRDEESTRVQGMVYFHPTEDMFVGSGLEFTEEKGNIDGNVNSQFYSTLSEPLEFWFELKIGEDPNLTGYLGVVEQF